MVQHIHQRHVADLEARKAQAIQSQLSKFLASAVIGLAGSLLAIFAPVPLVYVPLMAGSVFAIGWFARGFVEAKKINTRFYEK